MPSGAPRHTDPSPGPPEMIGATKVPVSRYVVFFGLVALGCLADLASKSLVFQRLEMPPSPTRWLWKDVVGLQTSLNEGALFGMGQGMVWAFAILSLVAAAGILYWLFVAGAARDLLLCVAMGSVTAGILGNLYDRLGMHGLRWNSASPLHAACDPVHAVRDWILVMIGNRPWPNFNIADSLLVCGAAVLVWHAFRHDHGKRPGAVATR